MPGLLSYTTPSITINQLGASQVLSGPTPGQIIMLIGTAPQGPDVPVLCAPSDAASIYGSVANAATLGTSLPTLAYLASIQKRSAGVPSPMFLACRVGVKRATLVIQNNQTTPTPSMTLAGVGQYAGSAGNQLAVEIDADASKNVTAIKIFSFASGSAVLLKQYTNVNYNLTTPQSIVDVINGDNPPANPASVINVVALTDAVNAPGAVATPTVAAFTGGTDYAAGMTYSSDTAAGQTISTALTTSLQYDVRFIVAGFDCFDIGPALITHMNTAHAQGKMRMAVIGPKAGTTSTALISGNTLLNSRTVCVGWDGAVGADPLTGTTRTFDGFYIAAAVAGMKASADPAATLIGQQLTGFLRLRVAPGSTSSTYATAPIIDSTLDSLAGAGYLTIKPDMVIRDSLTTVAYVQTATNAVNPYSAFNVQDIDDAVAYTVYLAVRPFLGQPLPPATEFITTLKNAVSASLGKLGATINGVNSIDVAIDQTTLSPTVTVSYITRYPIMNIVINTSYTFV